MERFTVERVKEAYAKTGRSPTRGQSDDGRNGSCGRGVISIAFCGNIYAKSQDLGITTDYHYGFTDGFDHPFGDEPAEDANEDYLLGYADGQAAAKAMGL